jgi:DNA-binding transcriptional MerR regulator
VNGAGQPLDRFEDENYPAYSMGAAAELLGVTPAFLRALGEARLITPHRSAGGHRRYTRHQLQLAARARELVDQGMTLAAACLVVGLEDKVTSLEDQLSDANRRIRRMQRDARRTDT